MKGHTEHRFVGGALTALALITAGCAGDGSPSGSHVKIGVAPLTLPGVTNACYRLTTYNGPDGAIDANEDGASDNEIVWQQSDVCASQYGNGEGAITYIGTCDPSAGHETNSVTLEVLGIFDADHPYLATNPDDPTDATWNPYDSGDPTAPRTTTFVNPCPVNTGCTLNVPCTENADTPVEFNLTIMRPAQQGFFDVMVSFEDIFCSAKFDSCYDENTPIELLSGPEGRHQTAVAAIACTGGPGTAGLGNDTQILLQQPEVICETDAPPTQQVINGQTVLIPAPVVHFEPPLDLTDGGNDYVEDGKGHTLYYAVYFGNEDLDCGAASCRKVYYNLAIDIEALVGNGPIGDKITSCYFKYGATAVDPLKDAGLFDSSGKLTDENAIYPEISFEGRDLLHPVALIDNNELQCFANPLNGQDLDGNDSHVQTAYIYGTAFDPGAATPFKFATAGDQAALVDPGLRTGPPILHHNAPGSGIIVAWCSAQMGAFWCVCEDDSGANGLDGQACKDSADFILYY